ncbi:hypothetical protein FPZ24_01745 [Sphingomonas panacisoli]|uniref:Circumsporozoite protein n=1 Tax=Sphingomonas panacisoli TaxID=1813879 RepID=A0A5B8LEL7_9SPHN|nr:hypothetical protein [Sphingomonas panacisoli]QDZ06349.1 hypothetical protein FPZ24_01745 [Sphingomonas panacisoli]
MKKLLILAAGALAIAGCHKNDAPAAPANDNAANITALDEGNLTEDANITDVPADDGDAPADVETNRK